MSEQEKTFYTKDELKEFEVLIEEKLSLAQSEYRNIVSRMRENEGTSIDSNNFSDHGNSGQEKEEAEFMMARQKKFIVNLENAIARIRNGSYGICKVTGKLIPKERLRAVPHTTTSMEGKRMLES